MGCIHKNKRRLCSILGFCTSAVYACIYFLRTKADAALEGEGFAGHILKIGAGQHDAGAADVEFRITEAAHGRGVYVLFKRFRIGVFKAFELCGPREGANDVSIDAVLAPFGSGYAGKTADAFLGSCIRALTEVSEKTCAGSKADDASLRLGEVGIRSLHIVERGIKAGVNDEVKLLGGMLFKGNLFYENSRRLTRPLKPSKKYLF